MPQKYRQLRLNVLLFVLGVPLWTSSLYVCAMVGSDLMRFTKAMASAGGPQDPNTSRSAFSKTVLGMDRPLGQKQVHDVEVGIAHQHPDLKATARSGLHRLVDGQNLGAVPTPKFIQHQHFVPAARPLRAELRSSRNPTLARVFRMRLMRCWLIGMYLS